MLRNLQRVAVLTMLCASSAVIQVTAAGLQSSDFYKLRSVTDVQLSPDGTRLAYVVESNDGPGRPYSQIWVIDVASAKAIRLGGEREPSSTPQWSPDGQWLAYIGREGDKAQLAVTRADGSSARLLAEVTGTNSPLPSTGKTIAWSPDGKRIAFISSVPGPETAEATGDPIVIRRYLYKPTASEGMTRFNDNRRLHVFVVDLATGNVRQLTTGTRYEHSIEWSPNGEEIAFVSNLEPNEDQFFNYDLFALRVADGSIRRLTATENAEYRPRWSPDGKTIVYQGTKRGLTDLETTMEDTHVWLIDADGTNRRELAGAIDNRQGAPAWSSEGSAVYFTVQERGNVRLYRLPVSGGQPQVVVNEPGSVGAWSIAKNDAIAYTRTTPKDLAQAFLKTGNTSKRLTDLNRQTLAGRDLAEVESFTFISADNKYEIEAFLTKPLGMTATSKHPLILNIHGGPHGQSGRGFNFKAQVYASRGWATLMVNFRGSTGSGQAFADAVFADQNGNEALDVLYGVQAARRRYLWVDVDRLGIEGGSYGGQLTNWLITQTSMFKAAIPSASISNLISYNYMCYYNQYEQMEWGAFPHQRDLMDVLWERSALKHVAKARTPTMLLHGENDNDVPIAEAEQFYIALRDVGVEAIMVRYPREGHGLREPKHVVDSIDRSIDWYVKHFPSAGGTSTAERRH